MLRFKGTRSKLGSMTVEPGRLYEVRLAKRYCLFGLWAVIKDAKTGKSVRCPYGSLEAFVQNWEAVR